MQKQKEIIGFHNKQVSVEPLKRRDSELMHLKFEYGKGKTEPHCTDTECKHNISGKCDGTDCMDTMS